MVNMDKKKIRDLKKAGFNAIPLLALNSRYFINSYCTIIDTNTDLVIYSWTPTTAREPIDIFLENGEVNKISPIKLYMITYYGDFEADIYDIGYGSPLKRYKYVISIKEILDNGILVLNNDIFKYSKKYDMYVNQLGVVYRKSSIIKHGINEKGYHMIYTENKNWLVHRIVYDAWIGILDTDNDIHHIDSNNWNNYYKNLQEISPKDHKLIKNENYIYTDETVYRVCELMSNGMRPVDAAKIVGIPAQTAVRYRNGGRPDISSKFNFPDIPRYKLAKLNDDNVRDICRLFETTNLSNKEIGNMYQIDKYTVQDIRNRITWRNISKDYNFESAVKNTKSQINNRRNSSITEEDVIKIYKLLKEGHRICAVRDMTGVSYSIIKKIKYKTRWSSITDKLDEDFYN